MKMNLHGENQIPVVAPTDIIQRHSNSSRRSYWLFGCSSQSGRNHGSRRHIRFMQNEMWTGRFWNFRPLPFNEFIDRKNSTPALSKSKMSGNFEIRTLSLESSKSEAEKSRNEVFVLQYTPCDGYYGRFNGNLGFCSTCKSAETTTRCEKPIAGRSSVIPWVCWWFFFGAPSQKILCIIRRQSITPQEGRHFDLRFFFSLATFLLKKTRIRWCITCFMHDTR